MPLKFKRLLIQPNGMITGGYFQYTLDPDAGSITYQGRVDAHIFLFSKSVPFDGTAKVDPEAIKSANITPGKEFAFGNLNLKVRSVEDKHATCDVSVQAGDVKSTGVAIFDLSADVISLQSLDATGNALGYQVHLVAND